MTTLEFSLKSGGTTESRSCTVSRAIIAGWTGRNKDAMEEHIAELEELGVKRPARTPMFYRVSVDRLAITRGIEVLGSASSGEAEFFLLSLDGEIWIGAGSDHTDREAEAVGVTLSKQMCEKVLAGELWRLSEVANHWDELKLTAHAVIDGERVLYQDGSVSTMLSPDDLIRLYAGEETSDGGFRSGDLMMSGTVPAIGGVRAGSRFEFELTDPILGRSISWAYDVTELPDLG
ncbi:MAG: DUF2848 domain-containing protein [Pseudomonadota bacterium]